MEAALFMFGYDLVDRPNRGQGAGAAPLMPVISDGPSHDPGSPTEDGWAQCKTTARGKPFEYRLVPAAAGIHTRDVGENTLLRFSDEELNRTLQALLRDFGDLPFPLANSVDGVPKGKVPNGLGTAFWKETGKSAGHTSRLAAVLQCIEIFKACENAPTAAKYWSLNRETLQVDGSGKVNIRPYLDAFIQGD